MLNVLLGLDQDSMVLSAAPMHNRKAGSFPKELRVWAKALSQLFSLLSLRLWIAMQKDCIACTA